MLIKVCRADGSSVKIYETTGCSRESRDSNGSVGRTNILTHAGVIQSIYMTDEVFEELVSRYDGMTSGIIATLRMGSGNSYNIDPRDRSTSIIEGQASEYYTIITNEVEWNEIGQSIKTYDVTFPHAPIGSVLGIASLSEEDGSSGYCSFKVNVTQKEGNTYTVTVTPIINGQIYTSKSSDMKATVQVIANHRP